MGRRAAVVGLASAGLGWLLHSARPAHGIARLRGIGASAMNSTTRIAREIVGGRCGALFHLDDLRTRPAAARLAELGHWRALLARTNIHPLEDVTRAFVTSTTLADTSSSALVIDLAIGDRALIERELRRIGEPSRRASAGALTVVTELDGLAYGVAQVGPQTIAAVPEAKLAELDKFDGAAGLPSSGNGEAAAIFADAPSSMFGAVCPWPETLSNLQIELAFSQWGATIDLVATSTSEEQAARDADALGQSLNALLQVDLLLFEVQLVGPMRCAARGDKVELFASLSRAELELLLALGAM